MAAQQKMGLLHAEVEQEKQILQQVEVSCREVEANTRQVEEELSWALAQYTAVSFTKEQLQAQVSS